MFCLLDKLKVVGNNELKMKKLMPNQQGFIPLLILVLLVVGAVIVIAYLRVQQASK
jgi:hypothetical protein